jgi:hypothetical protein
MSREEMKRESVQRYNWINHLAKQLTHEQQGVETVFFWDVTVQTYRQS